MDSTRFKVCLNKDIFVKLEMGATGGIYIL